MSNWQDIVKGDISHSRLEAIKAISKGTIKAEAKESGFEANEDAGTKPSGPETLEEVLVRFKLERHLPVQAWNSGWMDEVSSSLAYKVPLGQHIDRVLSVLVTQCDGVYKMRKGIALASKGGEQHLVRLTSSHLEEGINKDGSWTNSVINLGREIGLHMGSVGLLDRKVVHIFDIH